MKTFAELSKLRGLLLPPVLILLVASQGASALQRDTGTVIGQIRSPDGTPAAGVRVTAVVEPQPGLPTTDATTMERLTTTDMEGRYRLEDLRPGRYFIAAGFVDRLTYYPGVMPMPAASPVRVTSGAILPGIDFALAESAGVRVTGRIVGLPANMPPGDIGIVLTPEALRVRSLMATAARDGTFEFPKVPPGVWYFRTGVSVPRPTFQIEVKDSDVGPIELPAGPIVVGQVTVEDGTPLPVATTPGFLGIFISASGANLPSLMRLLRIAAPTANTVSPVSASSLAVVRGDGSFVVVNLPPGEYRIGARVPFGLTIKSMTFNGADILQTTMKIEDAGSAKGDLRVVLSKARSSAGVRVSGRVAGPPLTVPTWISMQPSGTLNEGGTGEVMVRPNGIFEFIGVPPGIYAAQVWTMPLAIPPPQVEVVVEDRDLTNVEIPSPSAAPAK
jgi:hypothetical protein